MKESIRLIKEAVSGERAMLDVREVANYHRIQCSTGFRAAAGYCKEKMLSDGLQARICSYPYDEKKWYWTCKSFLEWDCRDARCEMVYPKNQVLADFSANNIAVIQKSWPCDFKDKPLDIVLLDKGPKEESYGDIDLTGKLVFVRDMFKPYVDWAVAKRGAVGIITDFMREVEGTRERYDLFDTLNYTSFWWRDSEKEPHTFGFVLTPREGDRLAKVCKQVAEDHEKDSSKPPYPQATCFVDADLYPGAIEVVEELLPGETDEEILLVAHLCHPKASANDNASGVAASMEIMRTLKNLLDNGKLPPLKRGIRLFLVPEFSGTFSYLVELEEKGILPKIKAGLNLDMVGGRQSGGYGPLTICAQPHGAPSFVTDVAAIALDEVKKEVVSHNKDNYVSMFNSLVAEFTAGSDHYILSDPTIGIPTPMLGQWPDIAYHTSSDTVEVVDPYILHKSASIGAAYAYTLANLSEGDLPYIFNKMAQRCAEDLGRVVDNALSADTGSGETCRTLKHFETFYKGCCQDAERFFPGSSAVAEMIKREQQAVEALCDQFISRYLAAKGAGECPAAEEKACAAYEYVPERTCRGPVLHLDDYAYQSEESMAAYKAYTALVEGKLASSHGFEALVTYYIDGERTVNEIAALAITESRNGSVELVHAFVQLLVQFGVVKIK